MFRKQRKETGLWTQAPYYASLGFIVPLAAIVGVLIGYGLDSIFHTAPVLEAACAIAGGAAGVIELRRAVKKAAARSAMDASEHPVKH